MILCAVAVINRITVWQTIGLVVPLTKKQSRVPLQSSSELEVGELVISQVPSEGQIGYSKIRQRDPSVTLCDKSASRTS